MIDLIVSQGRVADRAGKMIEGAARIANAMEHRYGVKGRVIGEPAPPAEDDWSTSLPQARDTLTRLGEEVTQSVRANGTLTVLVNNTCSVSLATLPRVAREHPEAVILYIDGHGDFNTPATTDTGYLGGMVLAAACGRWNSGHGDGVRSEQAILVGARDIDAGELQLLSEARVRVIGPEEATPENVLRAIDGAPVWIHIDWDVLEPGYVPADYAVPGGMLPTQLKAVLEAIPAEHIIGIEMAEFNATEDEAINSQAVEIVLDTVGPVLEARRTQ